MQQGYINVNGVPTKVITWGKWVEESFEESDPKDIVLCIPGNPGITRFYTMFLQTIYEQLGYPVWIIGHAGHENPKNDLHFMPPLEGHEKVFSLQGQIDHKAAFIEKYVPQDARIHFIGHSIGAYIILKLLKIPSIKSRVAKSYLLFPTIEYMAETINGIFVTKILRHIFFILLFLAWFFSILPEVIQKFLVYIYCKISCIPKVHYKTIRCFIDTYVIKNVWHMGSDEMQSVRERDNAVLVENKDRIKLYYGASDNWAPLSYCDNVRTDIPGVDAEKCVRGFAHAFVLRNSRPMGNIVANWIKEESVK